MQAPLSRQFAGSSRTTGAIERAFATTTVGAVSVGFLLAAAFTPLFLGLQSVLELRDVDILFLIPVLIAATRWGLMPALAASFFGTTATAFVFHPPILSLKVFNPKEVLDLAIFVVVAVIASHLAAAARSNEAAAERSSKELGRLYAFSRRLALATVPADIYAAIQEHASTLADCFCRGRPTE